MPWVRPTLAEELIAEIRRVTSQPIRYLVVTHFHADHIYGLQAFKAAGATILGHPAGREYLNSETAALRLQASRKDLAPWIDEKTRLVGADRWLDQPETDAAHGLATSSGSAMSARPTRRKTWWSMSTRPACCLPATWCSAAGFRLSGRPTASSGSPRWAALIAFKPRVMIPGHGDVSTEPMADLELTRDYLVYLRKSMGEAARDSSRSRKPMPRTDWSRFDKLPLFKAANRMNAYNTYLLMEQKGFK